MGHLAATRPRSRPRSGANVNVNVNEQRKEGKDTWTKREALAIINIAARHAPRLRSVAQAGQLRFPKEDQREKVEFAGRSRAPLFEEEKTT
jgi:hypothetical protein